jgi:hypothetical protein
MTADFAYRMDPKGHVRMQKKECVQPLRDLTSLCLESLEESRRYDPFSYDTSRGFLYRMNCELVKGIIAEPSQITDALCHPSVREHDEHHSAGFFASALINNLPETVIVFDADLQHVNWIGYNSKHLVINRGSVGDYFGENAIALINFGHAGNKSAHHLGNGVKKIAVNAGTYGGFFAVGSKAVTIDIGANKLPRFSDGAGISILKTSSGTSIRYDVASLLDVTEYRAPLPEFFSFLDEFTMLIENCPEQLLEKYGEGLEERLQQFIGPKSKRLRSGGGA